ncbi:hypothetical protein QN224_24415 [Sinorhizobium sp. 8-89]|uniref:hypothetical protein n=1 Tax=Sinorhizobium sp. 7-81 TaxID=3049087 RepID=UPI0024C214DA|nr:hypothetical protein [Sinorhizobium sp. 7-81]MDK1388557.1 hypothetical protein [Sinorhizobium sp. 7-81]
MSEVFSLIGKRHYLAAIAYAGGIMNTAVSSARLYWENKSAFLAPKSVTIPVAVRAGRGKVFAVFRPHPR